MTGNCAHEGTGKKAQRETGTTEKSPTSTGFMKWVSRCSEKSKENLLSFLQIQRKYYCKTVRKYNKVKIIIPAL